MRAYKFLLPGGRAPFSGFRWPLPAAGEPGPWVEAELDPCAVGIHACRPADLPYWLRGELWAIELAEPVVELAKKVVARRGRIVGKVEGWDHAAGVAFGEECAARTRERAERTPAVAGYAEDATTFTAYEGPGVLGFVAARAAEIEGGPEAYAAERRRQAAWLAERLGLATVASGTDSPG